MPYPIKGECRNTGKTRFKKGQVANPNGRPKSILTKNEKLALLAEYARMNPKKANPVEAIRELNKMEGDYAPEKHAVLGDIVIEIVHRDRKQLDF